MSTASPEGGVTKRRSPMLLIVLSNLTLIVIFTSLFGPPLQKMSWRLHDLERRIERLEQRLDQSKDQVHP